jgi:4-oxalomesaconate tautomerase
MTAQIRIPCVMMRGGTSKGAYFLAADLPSDAPARDRVLLAAMGSPDPRQIDGMGGAHPLTSKIAIVSRSSRPDADIDYLFAQVVVNEARVDTAPTCGNILAGVGPFAIEQGLMPAREGETLVRIYMVNTKSLCTARIKTPGGEVAYDGDAKIAGVPGSSAPVLLDFNDIAGSSCGKLLPTGNVRDVIDGVALTAVDNGMPVVVMEARALGISGYESPDQLNADAVLKAKLESIRLKIGPKMNLGDVTKKVVPKMTMIAPARDGGSIATRTFIPHVCHEAIGVLGAVSVATACVIPGAVGSDMAIVPKGDTKILPVEHPTGEFTVQLEMRNGEIVRASLLRTTRRLFDGNMLVPRAVWSGVAAKPVAAAAQ